MRALLRPLATHSVFSPIEAIVSVFVLATLAYFHILTGIKHSSFFAPTFPTALRPAYARLSKGHWSNAIKAEGAVELQQIVFALDDKARKTNPTLTLNSSSLSTISNRLIEDVLSLSGKTYGEMCHSPSNVTTCFTHLDGNTLTLSFAPSARDDWTSALKEAGKFEIEGYQFEVQGIKREEPISEMKSGKWVAYAARALVLRFWELTKKADSLDILLVLVGYILMHSTFLRLFFSSRALGSNFWLSTGIFLSSCFAFLFTLPLCRFFGIPLDPVSLTEALPFLVCTVGFEKPLRLAREVMKHEHVLTPLPPTSPRPATPGQPQPVSMKPAGEVVLEALDRAGNSIVRDYALEIAVLLVGAYSRVGGLKEFCALASLAMTLDCVMLGTFYTAVLTVMVEVRRIKLVRTLKKEQELNSAMASGVQTPRLKPALSRVQTPKPGELTRVKSVGEKLSDALLGVKGSSLNNQPQPASKKDVTKTRHQQDLEENPMARLKLLVLASFLTLHILNFSTTLTPSTALARHNKHSPVVLPHRVDLTTPAIASALDTLAQTEFESSEPIDKDILVRVVPPMHVHVLPPAIPSPSLSLFSHVPTQNSGSFESFMSSWSSLVGDPVISKWIVVLLLVSVALNGYLLKGIAAGSGLGIAAFVSKSGNKSVKFSGGSKELAVETEVHDDVLELRPKKRASVIVEAAVPAPKEVLAPIVEERVTVARVEKPKLPPLPLDLATVDEKLSHVQPLATPSFAPASAPYTPSGSFTPKETVFTGEVRSLEDCIDIFENGPRPVSASLALLNDEEVVLLAQNGKIAAYALEKMLGDLDRAVAIRRKLISRATKTKTLEFSDVPMYHYDYSRVMGACCENVVGYMPIPLGIAGPLKIDGESYHIPMATAEGTLVASTSRGCKALNAGGGVTTVLTYDGMTRGPAIDFPSIKEAAAAKLWIESPEGYAIIKESFESTSRFAKLQNIKCGMAGRTLFVRFATRTGDAMGMNMISKATEKALETLGKEFPGAIVLALSGNYCTDKKPAAINWIEGRGKSIVAEAVVPGKVVKSVLKTTVEALCNLNTKKNLVGSAMAGSIGGFNAHAANILTAVFLATGQDPAQNVESSMCMTLMEPTNHGEDLLVTVSMPCIEVGTVGGGTVLAPQGAVLEMLGIKGAHPTNPGQNAQQLARIVASACMAGELSLISALAAGHLVRAHLAHNRSQVNTPVPSRPLTPAPGTPKLVSLDAGDEKARVGRGLVRPGAPSESVSTDVVPTTST